MIEMKTMEDISEDEQIKLINMANEICRLLFSYCKSRNLNVGEFLSAVMVGASLSYASITKHVLNISELNAMAPALHNVENGIHIIYNDKTVSKQLKEEIMFFFKKQEGEDNAEGA